MTKKFVSMFLALAMCLSLAATNVVAVEEIAGSSHPEIDFDGPMIFYPFVYTEEPSWAWAREIIGDCSSLVPGYLYLQDLRTKEITQIIEEPVDTFCLDNEILYCLIDGSAILRTNYWGEDKTVLYTTQHGTLANLEYWEDVLLFSDGDHVIRLDFVTGQEKDMGIYEGITAIYFAEDGAFTWRDAEGIEYARDENGHDEKVAVIGATEICEVVGTHAEISDPLVMTPYAAILEPVTKFPLPEYPVGSYYTTTGQACTTHNDVWNNPNRTCIMYRDAIQCEGFGRYVLDRYANILPSPNSSWPLTDSHIHNEKIAFNTQADVKNFFQNSEYAKYGTYLRFDHEKSNGDPGTHTAVIADITSTSVTLYDANYTDSSHYCMVQMKTYLFSNFIKDFQAINRIAAHSFDGAVKSQNATYHQIPCTVKGCNGYRLEEHYTTAIGKYATCEGCGYVGEIWNAIPLH